MTGVTTRFGRWAVRCAAALLCLMTAAGTAVAADELHSRLDAEGAIRAWLISEPIDVPGQADVSVDLLAEYGGEADLKPTGLTTQLDGREIDWRVVFPTRPNARADTEIPYDNTAYYFSTWLKPATTGNYTLTCLYWSDAVVWLDGEKIIDARRKWLRSVASHEAAVELHRDRRHHVLVKVTSLNSQAYGGIVLTDAAGMPADATAILPVGGGRADLLRYAPEAVDVRIDNYRFFEADRTARLIVHVSPFRQLPPVADAELRARARIETREGERVATENLGRITCDDLRAENLTFTWRPRRGDVSASYVVSIDLFDDKRKLGTADRTFYCPEGIHEMAKELGKQAERFWKERAREDIYGNRNLAYLGLKLEQYYLLAETERDASNYGQRALALVNEARERVELMEKRLEVRPTPGMHEFAYISPIDDSAQPYYIYVPRSYDPFEAAPLIVYLHGYNPDLNKINWQYISEGLKRLCEENGYLIVAPFGRSNTDFQGIGEQDVMHVLDLMLDEHGFNIARDRVYLVGYSMGGMGAYTIASHSPDRWAGVVSLAGRASFYMWKDVEPDDLQPFKHWLIGLEYAAEMPENFRHVPVLALQGESDSLVKVAQSRRFIRTLTDLGYDAKFKPVPEQDHWIADTVFSDDAAFEWMARRRRPAAPRTVTFATWSLKYNRAYWLAIDDFRQWGKRALIEATVGEDNDIRVIQTNVAAFSLDLPHELIAADLPVTVSVADREFTFRPPFDHPLHIVLEPARQTPLRKTPDLCGPIKDVHNKPFIFVYGTQGNPVENQPIYKKAKKALNEWRDFVNSAQVFEPGEDILLVRDRDLEDEQKKRCSLILFGTPRTNSVLAEIADRLPIQIKDEHTFGVGDTTLSGKDLGLNMIYPSPFADDRYVVIKTGTYYGDSLSVNHKFDMLPDYIIYDQSQDYDVPGYYDGKPNRSRCAGYFDKYWQLSDDLMWTQPADRRDSTADLPWRK